MLNVIFIIGFFIIGSVVSNLDFTFLNLYLM